MIKVDRKKCIYCAGCVSVCPVNALTLNETEIVCDASKCTKCGICERFCPAGAITVIRKGDDDEDTE